LFVVGFLLTSFTVVADSPGPQEGSVSLSGTVPGKAPAVAATIKSPTSGQRFSTTPVKITGTCPATTLVEIFKNDIFAGSTPCNDDGTYSIEIDLLIGANTLIARVYDSLNQPGPDSNAVNVFYDVLPGQGSGITPLDFGGEQLLLNTDAVFRGVFPDRELSVPIDILGGTPPYAVNVQWGDSTNKVISRNDNASFNASHTYKKPGTYKVTLQATDSGGRVAFLAVAAIVNGQPDLPVAATTEDAGGLSPLFALWPLYTATVAVVISFWLGEVREKRVLAKRGALLPQ